MRLINCFFTFFILSTFVSAQVVFDNRMGKDVSPDSTGQGLGVMQTMVGFHVGFKRINPANVNNYLRMIAQNGNGITPIDTEASLGLSVLFHVNDKLKIRPAIEFGGAQGGTYGNKYEEYTINRFALGVQLGYYIPVEAHAVFVSAGPIVNLVGFKGVTGMGIGLRSEIGFSILGFRRDFDFYGLLDLGSAKTNGSNGLDSITTAGAGFGIRINF
jgi:hypothetical protein